jgi:hypothetical protein
LGASAAAEQAARCGGRRARRGGEPACAAARRRRNFDGLDADGISDPVSFLATMTANNLIPNLLGGERVAPLIPQLIEQVDKVATADYWRLLGEPPLAELARLREVLVDLHAMVAEAARGERTALVALRAAGKGGVTAAARVARQRAETRMQATANRVEQEFGNAGFAATVRRHAGEPQSHRWPSDDFLVLVEVPTIFAWQQSVERLADLCRPLLEDRVGFLMAPVRDGRVVASFGVKVLSNMFPAFEEVGEWPELPLLDERLGRLVRRGFAGVDEASSIIASLASDVLHDEEAAALEAAFARAREALASIHRFAAESGRSRARQAERVAVRRVGPVSVCGGPLTTGADDLRGPEERRRKQPRSRPVSAMVSGALRRRAARGCG